MWASRHLYEKSQGGSGVCLLFIAKPTFFFKQKHSLFSSPFADDSDEDVSHCVLVPRGCPPCSTPSVVPSLSPSIPIPTLSCSPHGMLVFSSSPSSSLPPLPCGSAPRRNASPKHDVSGSQGSLRLSHSNRNSVISLLSSSTCSDTSYILGRYNDSTHHSDQHTSYMCCKSFNVQIIAMFILL